MSEAFPQPPTEALGDVAKLLAPLDGLDETPVGQHPAAFDEVHAGLRRTLAGQESAS